MRLVSFLIVVTPSVVFGSLYDVGTRSSLPELTSHGDAYLDGIQPILSKRCVACHGCYESPCQANLQSYEGVRRGYHPEPIFSRERRHLSTPTRMKDAVSIEQWRRKGFLPFVTHVEEIDSNDHPANADRSVLVRLIEQGTERNGPGFSLAATSVLQKKYDEESKHQCLATDAQHSRYFSRSNEWKVLPVAQFLRGNPSAGMPFALPGLSKENTGQLVSWVAAGSQGPSVTARKKLEMPAKGEVVLKWQEFLNTPGPKGKLAARYIFEHVYTAHLSFDEAPGEFFELIRAKNTDGAEIVTDRPYDSPGAAFHYRLKKVTEAIVQKKHLVWRLNTARLARLRALFLDADWGREEIVVPAYGDANPFANFASIPAAIRSRFMMENSKIIVGAMVQGSVCLGVTATYAIRDHFWGWFLKPESDPSVLTPQLGLGSWDALGTESVGDEGALEHFARTAVENKAYQLAFEKNLRLWLQSKGRTGLSLNDIWDGSGDSSFPNGNPNAWLNITRHERSTTVQFGEEGGLPQSIWVLSYSNFERLYYNLVPHFKEWGSLTHRMATWRIMSYVRLEGEDLAISFLPEKHRATIRGEFTRGIGALLSDLFPQYSLETVKVPGGRWGFHKRLPNRPTEIAGFPNGTAWDSVRWLVHKARLHLNKVDSSIPRDTMSADRQFWQARLFTLTHKSEKAFPARKYSRYVPNIVMMRIAAPEGPWVYTITADRNYKAHNVVLLEKLAREPERDTIALYQGTVGAYPNTFLDIAWEDRDAFIAQLERVDSDAAWLRIEKRWGVSRNSDKFWDFYDDLHAWKNVSRPENDPAEQGILDLSQYRYF